MGSVMGVVAEDESGTATSPPVPVRYRHSPYGETEVGAADGFTDGVPVFDAVAASADAVEGRFPGGQNLLFQGLWVDPVVGVAYVRARWYVPRSGSWLSEDPLLDVDSVNVYAFVGWQPSIGRDPHGLSFWRKLSKARKIPERFDRAKRLAATRDLWTRVKRSDVIGVASDGRATVGGRRVHLPRDAVPGEIYPFRAPSGAQYDVPITKEGWVDFSRYSKHEIPAFQMTGDSRLDIQRAQEMYKKATGMDTPVGYTWHHSPDGSTMELVPTELNNMTHTGGDAITRAAIEKVADADGFFLGIGPTLALAGSLLSETLAPNTSKASGLVDTSVSVVVDTLDTLDPGVQDVYMGLMWAINETTDLDVEVQLLEDINDVFLADETHGSSNVQDH